MTFNPAINGWAIFSEACRVMAKRLREVCGLPESEPLWKAGSSNGCTHRNTVTTFELWHLLVSASCGITHCN